ncbi:MAG: TIGR03067 domain-containing protein [Gemmataceae bacterium]|nr:TIGR03067 domain-containing protein [Gemmataceae bacterium]
MRWCTGLALGAVLVAAAGRADDPPKKDPPPAGKDDPPKKDPPAKADEPKKVDPKKAPGVDTPGSPKPKPADPPKARKGLSPDPRDVFQRLQGTWPVVAWEEGGEAAPDADKRGVFFGGNVLILRRGGKTHQAGPVLIDPSADPPTFDAVVREGADRGTTLLGVYKLDGPDLTLCYDPKGKTRPAGFDPDPADGFAVVKLRKPKPPADEAVEIAGRYTSELVEATGKTVTTEAVVERRGDGYLVTYTLDGKLLFVGTALRRGDTLSMCWVSSGQAGVSQYRIEKGPKLVGEYTTLAGIGVTGSEVLKPWRRVD